MIVAGMQGDGMAGRARSSITSRCIRCVETSSVACGLGFLGLHDGGAWPNGIYLPSLRSKVNSVWSVSTGGRPRSIRLGVFERHRFPGLLAAGLPGLPVPLMKTRCLLGDHAVPFLVRGQDECPVGLELAGRGPSDVAWFEFDEPLGQWLALVGHLPFDRDELRRTAPPGTAAPARCEAEGNQEHQPWDTDPHA